jgi:hypothetical protein
LTIIYEVGAILGIGSAKKQSDIQTKSTAFSKAELIAVTFNKEL